MDFEPQFLMFLKLVNDAKIFLEDWIEVVFDDLCFPKECPFLGCLIQSIKVDLRITLGEDVKVLKFQA